MTYKTETQLCVAFADYARTLEWAVYPETSGCDLLLVARDGVRTRGCRVGDQVAVQAKLVASIPVLAQALPRHMDKAGPDFSAVLVPGCTRKFDVVARRCDVLVITPGLSTGFSFLHIGTEYRNEYASPLWTPDIEVWTEPGVASPESITPWKMKALRLCKLALRRGYLMTSDFKEARISMTAWHKYKWIVVSDQEGKKRKYTLNPDPEIKPPHLLYPDVFAQL